MPTRTRSHSRKTPTPRAAAWWLSLCALVALIAGCADDPTRVYVTVEADAALAVDGLVVIAGPDARRPMPYSPRVELQVPDAWADAPHTVTFEGAHAGDVVARGSVTITARAHEAIDVTVQLAALGQCDATCEPGATRCAGGAEAVEACGVGADGCLIWDAAEVCAGATPFCAAGACVATCQDDCTAGATECDGAGGVRTCGNHDGDACREWSTTTACGTDLACTAGACVATVPLTVMKTGAGSGTVTSNLPGITCGADCTEAYPVGAMLTLTATPDATATFAGWSGGGCSGTGPCTVTLAAATTVRANFSRGCEASTCSVETMASSSDVAVLALDDTHVYWTDPLGDQVMRRAKAGGAAEVFAAGQDGAWGIAVDATHVYWTNTVSDQLMRRAKSGGPITTLATGQDGASRVALDATHIYWTNNVGDQVMRGPKAGGPIETVAFNQDAVDGLALDATHVYWTTWLTNNVMRRAKAASPSGPYDLLAFEQRGALAIAVDATHVYWTNSSGDEVMRCLPDGSSDELFASGQDGADGLALDATHVYWANFEGDQVMRRAKGGGPVEVVAAAQDGADSIALDATHVYWLNDGTNTVNRLSRCACGL